MKSPKTSTDLVQTRVDRLFLHFLDSSFIEDKGGVAKPNFVHELRLATRLAIASANTVFISASSYIENPLCRKIIGEFDDLIKNGFVVLTSSASNIEELIYERLSSGLYLKGGPQYEAYALFRVEDCLLPVVPRRRSATRDIKEQWRGLVEAEKLQRLVNEARPPNASKIERRLNLVPTELGELGFIPEHVFKILDIDVSSRLLRTRIRSVINEAYVMSYTRDLAAGLVIDLRYLASSFALPSFGRNVSYATMIRHLQENKQLDKFINCPPEELFKFGKSRNWEKALCRAVTFIGSESQVNHFWSSFRPAENYVKNVSEMEKKSEDADPLTKQKGHAMLNKSHLLSLCLTVATSEFIALREVFTSEFGPGETVYLDDSRRNYAIKFVDKEFQTDWLLVGLSFQGGVESAVMAQQLVTKLTPSVVLMTGMCMGIPAKKLHPGTVIIPNEVFGFDHQRITEIGTTYRPHAIRVDNGLYKLARIAALDNGLGYKVIADKGLASASIKIENAESVLVKMIESTLPDVVAFDMEGWGFYNASEHEQILWVKAIADSGESQNHSEGGREQKQNVQANATNNAAKFSIHVIRAFAKAKNISSP